MLQLFARNCFETKDHQKISNLSCSIFVRFFSLFKKKKHIMCSSRAHTDIEINFYSVSDYLEMCNLKNQISVL